MWRLILFVDNLVLAVSFAFIESFIGNGNKLFNAHFLAVIGKSEGHSYIYLFDAEAHAVILNFKPDILHKLKTFIAFSRNDNEDFLTAPAADNAFVTHIFSDYIRNGYQYLVTSVMAVRIVDALEIVNVAENNAERLCAFFVVSEYI